MNLLESFKDKARKNPQRIVLPEGTEPRTVKAASMITREKLAKVTLIGVPDRPGVAARIFKALADAAINIDMIVQNISHGTTPPSTDLSFTVDKPELLKSRKVIDGLQKEVGFKEVSADEKIAKLSIVGVGMRSHCGIAARMFETLAREGVNIDMISTSEIKVSVVFDLAKAEPAMKAVHAAFLG